jgi:hypothetical protein
VIDEISGNSRAISSLEHMFVLIDRPLPFALTTRTIQELIIHRCGDT